MQFFNLHTEYLIIVDYLCFMVPLLHSKMSYQRVLTAIMRISYVG